VNDVALSKAEASESAQRNALPWKSAVDGRLRVRFVFVVLFALMAIVLVLGIGNGAYPLRVEQVIAGCLRLLGIVGTTEVISDAQYAVLSSIRVPRVLFGFLIGAALAVSGAALQSLFRNPLADPGLIGVSAGAAVSVTAVIVLGATTLSGLTTALGLLTLPVAGFVGGLMTTALVYLFAQHEGRTSMMTMILAGIAVNALASACIGLFSLIANDEQLRNITFWTFGSLGSASWAMLAVIVIPMLICAAALYRVAFGLNALMFGEAEAAHLGFNVQRLKLNVIVCAALLAGFSVSVSGVIGFVALVAPHVIRLLIGPDVRYLIPACAILGGTLLVGADVVARTWLAPSEVPIGVITALIGAPFFLMLLIAQRRSAMEIA
jgi:iron complex transport system permease protein